MNDRFLKFLGLTRKSGNLIAGANLSETALKRGKLSLIILAADASDGTKHKFQAMAEFNKVEIIETATMDELGYAIGKGQISVIGVTDQRMSKKLKELCLAM